MAKREKSEPQQVGMYLLEKVIGKRPRKPQTYEMRKRMGTAEDLAFCKEYDDRIEKWEKDAEIERNRVNKKREAELEAIKNFKIKENPEINPDAKKLYADFKELYKIINKKSFNTKNPYSDSQEPIQYIFTLIYYFLKDERFFKSPLLRKDLSEPSFDKGTCTVGGYGCGKTSTWNTLIRVFSYLIKHVRKEMPKNEKELIKNFDLNSCISSDVVNTYNTTKEKTMINELLNPLKSHKDLYIDDILREQDASNFGKINIFLMVLTHRADRNYRSHLTLNYIEEFEEKLIKNVKTKVPIQNTEKALAQFRDRYDGRIHDRIFGGFNIIELKGKSFRR